MLLPGSGPGNPLVLTSLSVIQSETDLLSALLILALTATSAGLNIFFRLHNSTIWTSTSTSHTQVLRLTAVHRRVLRLLGPAYETC